MEQWLNPLTVTFAAYILVMLSIGFLAYRYTSNLSDYILGGRKLGGIVTALSAGASDMSGWLLMGLPGAVYIGGISQSWIAVGLIIGAWLNWIFVAGRLRIFTAVYKDTLTLPDYFSSRFNDSSHLLKIIATAVILIFFTIYCASGIVAGGRLFESTFGIEYHYSIWFGASATIIYVFIGGFLAVSWTDMIQATLMMFALLITAVAVVISVGDFGQAIESIQLKSEHYTKMSHNLSTIGIISLLAWGLGYIGQPHILVRFMAIDSIKSLPKARRICINWMILCLGSSVAVGFLGIAYFIKFPHESLDMQSNNEQVFLELTKILLNPWLAGVILSGVLAAIMSTLSCQLLVASSSLTEDLYRGFIRKSASQKELIWVGRAMVFLIAFVAILIAQNPDSRVLGLVAYAWAGFGAAFGPVLLTSLFWKRMTRNGALYGMSVGAITVLIYRRLPELLEYFNVASSATQLREQHDIFNLYEIVPGFIAALIAIFIGSLCGKPVSRDVLMRFEMAQKEHRKQLQ